MKYEKRIIILEDCKFDWTPEQISQAKTLFERGLVLSEVADTMKEKVIHIGLLYLHLKNEKEL